MQLEIALPVPEMQTPGRSGTGVQLHTAARAKVQKYLNWWTQRSNRRPGSLSKAKFYFFLGEGVLEMTGQLRWKKTKVRCS